jgi:hypothetical protein
MNTVELVAGSYDKKNLMVMDEHPVTYTLDERYSPEINQSLLIAFEDIDIYSHIPINYSKYYYHPNQTMSYLTNRTTKFLNELGIYNFFETNFQVNNSISFKIKNEWYSFITNSEYILQPIVDFNNKHVRIYFNKNSDCFYKIVKGKRKFKKINKIELPMPTIFSYDLIDLYLFEGYDFIEDVELPNITDIKEDLRDILNGLDYYFVGTSIYDQARDIDIFIPPTQYEDAMQRLNNKYEKIKDSDGHLGCLFKTNLNLKIDLMPSPYGDEVLSVNNNSATPLFMYFIQANYYVSIKSDNVSDLFKIWRFNKLLETGNSLGILKIRNNYFQNTFLLKDRFKLYYDIVSNKDSNELVDIFEVGVAKLVRYKLNNYYYIIIKSLHPGQSLRFEIDEKFKNIKVLDDTSISTLTTRHNVNNTEFNIHNLNGYVLIECEMYE